MLGYICTHNAFHYKKLALISIAFTIRCIYQIFGGGMTFSTLDLLIRIKINYDQVSTLLGFNSNHIIYSGGSRISRRGGVDPLGGRVPPTWVLFGKNVCENKRIWSRRGGMRRACPLDPPMIYYIYSCCLKGV